MAVAWSAAPLRAEGQVSREDLLKFRGPLLRLNELETKRRPSCAESLEIMPQNLLKEHSPNRLTDVEEAQALDAGLKVCSACQQKRFLGNWSSLESFHNQITPVLQFLRIGQWDPRLQAYLKRAGKAQARNALSKYDELKELKKSAKKAHLESQTPPLALFKTVIEENYHEYATRHRLCKGKTRNQTNVLFKASAKKCEGPVLDEYAGVVASVFHNISDCMGLKERDRKVLFSVFAHESGFNNMARSTGHLNSATCMGQLTAAPIKDLNRKNGPLARLDVNNPQCKKVEQHFQPITAPEDEFYVPKEQECTLTQNPVSCMVYSMLYAKTRVLKHTTGFCEAQRKAESEQAAKNKTLANNSGANQTATGSRLAFYRAVIAYNAGPTLAQTIQEGFIANYEPQYTSEGFDEKHFTDNLEAFLLKKAGYEKSPSKAEEIAGYPIKVWAKLPKSFVNCKN